MGRRSCESCGRSIEGKRAAARFCSDTCRKRTKRAPASPSPAAPTAAASTRVGDALAAELTELGVAESYEGVVALGLARQLDNGTITGTAYVSLSKELDRRVESLRLKAERPEDPAAAVKGRLAEKQSQLRLA